MCYLLLKAQRVAATKTEFVFRKAGKMAPRFRFSCRVEN